MRDFRYENNEVLVDATEEMFDSNGKPISVRKFRGTMIMREPFSSMKKGKSRKKTLPGSASKAKGAL